MFHKKIWAKIIYAIVIYILFINNDPQQALFAQTTSGDPVDKYFGKYPGISGQIEIGIGYYRSLLPDIGTNELKIDKANRLSGRVDVDVGYQHKYLALYPGFVVGGPITQIDNDTIKQTAEYGELHIFAEGRFYVGYDMFICPKIGVNYGREVLDSKDKINDINEKFTKLSSGVVFGGKLNSPIIYKNKDMMAFIALQYLRYTSSEIFSDLFKCHLRVSYNNYFCLSFGPFVGLKNNKIKIANISITGGNNF